MRFAMLLVFVLLLSVARTASSSVAIDWGVLTYRAAIANHRQAVVPLALIGSSSSLTKLAIYVVETLSSTPEPPSDKYEALHSGSSLGDSALLATPLHKSVGSPSWANNLQGIHKFSHGFGNAGSQTGPGLGSS